MVKIKPLTHCITATVLLFGSILACALNTGNLGRFLGGVNDFVARYASARLIGTSQFYDIQAGYAEEERAIGLHLEGTYNDRLPWPAMLMAPLTRLPYQTVYGIFIAVSLLGFAVMVSVWLLRYDAVIWGCVSLPLALSILVGQETALLATCLVLAVRCLEVKRDIAAGILLALCTVKPHLFLLIPLALVAHRRWRALASASLATGGLLIAGTIAAGMDWPTKWMAVIRVLRDPTQPGYIPSQCPSVFYLGVNPGTIVVALIAASIFAYCIWQSHTIALSLAFAITGSILIAPHATLSDMAVLFVGTVALPAEGRLRWARIALLCIPYLAIIQGSPWNPVLAMTLFATGVIYISEKVTMKRTGQPGAATVLGA